MKFENFEKATKLVEEIRAQQSLLEDLQHDGTTLVIKMSVGGSPNSFTTIGIGGYEHPFADYAVTFVNHCIDYTERKIAQLTEELLKM